jgi:polar amino acid transport system ATP-binding protein
MLATHEMGFAREVADRICFLQAGSIYEQGPPAEIFGDPEGERTQAFLRSLKKAGRL